MISSEQAHADNLPAAAVNRPPCAKPLFVELFAGLHGWGEGALAEGFKVIGFDIVDMCAAYGKKRPEGIELVLQDVLTMHGSQLKDAAVIVGSPPCQKYSWLAMPWSRSTNPENSKAAKALRKEWETKGPDNRLFDACFRIQREAIDATGGPCPDCGHLAMYTISTLCRRCNCTGRVNTRYIPLVIENVRGAIPWVGRSVWNYGNFHLWGDIPALMPFSRRAAGDGTKTVGHVNKRDGHSHTRHLTNQRESDGIKIGGDWFSDPKSTCRKHGSKSKGRKQASAEIAKIPLPLAKHIASVYFPRSLAQGFRPESAAGNKESDYPKGGTSR